MWCLKRGAHALLDVLLQHILCGEDRREIGQRPLVRVVIIEAPVIEAAALVTARGEGCVRVGFGRAEAQPSQCC